MPPPSGYHVENRLRLRTIVGGAGLFAVAYVAVGMAAAGSRHEAPLWFPVAGPLVQIARTDSGNGLGITALALDAAAQIYGLGMLAYGLIVPARVLVPDKRAVAIVFAPMQFGRSVGLSALGSF